MNPTTETRYALVRYIVLWHVAAVVWAAVFGPLAAQGLALAALDGAVFGAVCGFLGIQLWNVLKYGAEQIRIPILRAAMHVAVGTLFVAVAVGAETVAVWLAAGTLPTGFAATIPVRCLTTAAVYVCFVLWYWSAAAGNNARDDFRADERQPSVDGTVKSGVREAAEKSAGETAGETAATATTAENDTDKAAFAYPIDRVTVRGAGGRIEVIATDEIVCIQAEGDYVAIVTERGRHLKEGTMKWFEEALPRARFVRVHRSCIVAVGHISRIETSGRDHTLMLRGGGTIRISDSGYRLLRQRLGL